MMFATEKDLPLMVEILTLAFSDNLSVNRCVKQTPDRIGRIKNQVKYIARISLRNRMAFINEEKTGVVLCNLSHGKKANVFDDIWFLWKVSGLKLGLQLMKREKLLKQIIPDENCCHLWFIGVSPEWQGKGTGSEMIIDLKKSAAKKNYPSSLKHRTCETLLFMKKTGSGSTTKQGYQLMILICIFMSGTLFKTNKKNYEDITFHIGDAFDNLFNSSSVIGIRYFKGNRT